MTVTAIEPTDTTTTAIAAYEGHFGWYDPRELVIDPFNHRKARGEDDNGTEPDQALIDSIVEFGVNAPLLLRPQTGAQDGALGVVFGQRRMKAAIIAAERAIEAGQPIRLVPAIVREDLRDVDDEALALSVIENVHRRQATTLDVLDAAEQLSLMPVGKLRKKRAARALGIKPEEVAAAPQAAKLSTKALREANAAAFDLVEMADYQSLETLGGALTVLKRAKKADVEAGDSSRGHWAHALAGLRQKQKDEEERARLIADFKSKGIPVVAWNAHREHGTSRSLSDLVTDIGNTMTAELHQKCPGHAVALLPGDTEVEWLCADWKRYDHELTDSEAAAAKAPKSTPEMLEAVRKVRRYNKAWRTARDVRREYIAQLCAAGGEANDATWVLILSTITGTSDHFSRAASRPKTDLISSFLGMADPNKGLDHWRRVRNPFAPVIATTAKTRRWRLLLAQVAAMFESEVMHDGAWRNVEPHTVTWLSYLKEQGYKLSEVEAEILAEGIAKYKPSKKTK
ncbi:ParB N-terminal domain-containing protein [Streptomyces sp. H27-H1]|uniref:ParB/RepB/Spo0J family partition protein n=1 Tax=Streptomyces sp. H27-H1 TaxID=2996461 RepID=UPI00226F1B08|nr:ParB N-terminal domain-containing protein [Streptomyces sp. H27-H1]MCY0931167.1 ParB N-terminal domain-containing protein [Streptomyces sp. H27-H1]